VVGGNRQTVSITFVSSTGEAINKLSVSGLASLPSGWTGPSSFSCSTVTTGSGCVLNLSYAPSAVGSGTVSLTYAFTNALGASMTNTVSIPYSATSNDNVVAAAAPTGQVNAIVGNGSQAVMLTFTTDDGQAASGLALTSSLTTLPAGWSSTATSFACASVSTGNGCQLALTFAPRTAGSGTSTLSYGYTDNAGEAKTGSASIAYAATTHDNVVAAAAPTGQVNAIVGNGSQAVMLTFTTDDGQAASGLTLTSLLTALPAGWSSTATSFACASVSAGNGCQLGLSFAPLTAGSGTVTLNYGYTDNAHTPKTGSASIAYAATTDDNVAGTVSPSGQVTALAGGSGTNVNVTFATDDGNPASNLAITAGLGALPSGWSGPGSFSCSTISAGTACQLALTYAPQYTGSALTLTLNYSYTDNAGNTKTGTLNVSYLATGPHLYIANLVTALDECSIGTGGVLSTCAATPTSNGPVEPTGIAFNGNTAYIADFGSSAIDVCAVNADGSLANCSAYSSFPTNWTPWALTVVTAGNGNTYLYATDVNTLYGSVQQCSLAADGSISGCVPDVCAYNSDGSISGCTATGSGFNNPSFITINNSYVYVVDEGAAEGAAEVSVCTAGGGGALTSCATSTLPGGTYNANSVAFYDGQAYVDDDNGNLWLCSVDSGTGALTSCVQGKGGNSFSLSQQLAIH
jgi:hypothetical protein